MNRPAVQLSVCACAVLGAAIARADDTVVDGETIVIEGRAPGEAQRDRTRALGDAPFVTVVHADDHAATSTVADALATSAGAQVRSLGGLGAFQSVSVRGAAPGHTAVLVDGIPLARIASVTTDLGRFTLDSFGQVELYRGSVPIELGGAGVGGAINLVTRLGRGERGERVRASIGAGSFGARHARLHYGDEHGRLRSATSLGYLGADGDFTYFFDGGTPLNPRDDTEQVRRNNGFDQLELASRVGTAGERLIGGARVVWKRQGLPGTVNQPTSAANMSTIDVIADARGDVDIGAATARQLGYLLVEHQVLRDPQGELGLGTQDRGYLTLSGGASSAWAIPFGTHRASAGLDLRGDRFRDADRDGMRAALVGTRGALGASASVDIGLAARDGAAPPIVITPAVRVDIVRTAPTPMTEGPDAFADVDARRDLAASPRLTARALVAGDVAVKGSAGRYVRLPTLIELFGNRGAILGSPELRAERGSAMDVGIVWAPPARIGPVDRILVETAAFATRSRDTIALISTAGYVARAENIGATQTYGGELVATARAWRTLTVTASYTRLVSEQRTIDPNLWRKALPRTPGHLLYARADVARHWRGRLGNLWLDVAAQSTSYLDRANFQRVPGRALVGAGTRVEIGGGVAAALSFANLTNTRVVELPGERAIDPARMTALSDLAGFPLPGRSVYASLEWSH